jgi:hypothetical protein
MLLNFRESTQNYQVKFVYITEQKNDGMQG